MKTRKPRKSPQKPQPPQLIEIDRGERYRILFDRATKDYAVEVDGQPVGWRADVFGAMRLVNEALAEKGGGE